MTVLSIDYIVFGRAHTDTLNHCRLESLPSIYKVSLSMVRTKKLFTWSEPTYLLLGGFFFCCCSNCSCAYGIYQSMDVSQVRNHINYMAGARVYRYCFPSWNFLPTQSEIEQTRIPDNKLSHIFGMYWIYSNVMFLLYRWICRLKSNKYSTNWYRYYVLVDA